MKNIAVRKTRACMSAVLLGSLALNLPQVAHAQAIKWEQKLNLPKGLNMPNGVKADILGIELGDTYTEAKAKLEKLAAEGLLKSPQAERTLEQQNSDEIQGVRRKQPYREERSVFRLQQKGASSVAAASFVKRIHVSRELKGTGAQTIDEEIVVWFSAPSSGHQVIGVERLITYYVPSDQPRISELIAQLSQKYRNEPLRHGNSFRYAFNDGRAYVLQDAAATIYCRAYHDTKEAADVPKINQKGDCDIMLDVRANPGISPDHAASVKFVLADNERTKANLDADFTFFRELIKKMQDGTRGETPKL